MRFDIGLLALAGLSTALPTPSTPEPLAPDAVLTSALVAPGDTIVCQGTLESGSCESVHAQGACVTLGNNAFHKVRNIYQAKGSICKYFDNDCSALEPVVMINSNKQNLWLDLDAEVGARIGLVLCRNDWPMAQQSEAEIEKRGFPVCNWDANKGEYVCDGQMADVQVDTGAGVTVKGFPSCHFDITKGEYVCDGKATATKARTAEVDAAIVAGQFPDCHLDIKKGEYVCDGQAPAPPYPSVAARQLVTYPDCHFDVEKGEYVCEKLAPTPSPDCHFDIEKGEYVCDGQVHASIISRQAPSTGCHFDVEKGEYICDSCHFDTDKGEYICKGQGQALRYPSITARQPQSPGCHFDVEKGVYICNNCHFDVEKGQYICKGRAPPALRDPGITARQAPSSGCHFDVEKGVYICDSCHFDVEKGEYICKGQTLAPRDTNIAESSDCHFDVDMGEYICIEETLAVQDVAGGVDPTAVQLCNSKGCWWMGANQCLMMPGRDFDRIVQRKNSLCTYYKNENCKNPQEKLWAQVANQTKLVLAGSFFKHVGAIRCQVHNGQSPRSITAEEAPSNGCYFDVEKGEYICVKPRPHQPRTIDSGEISTDSLTITSSPVASTATTDLAQGDSTTIKVCNEKDGGAKCISLSARANCQIFPEGFAHAALKINQPKGLTCLYYADDCDSPKLHIEASQKGAVSLVGPGIKKFGAVWCTLS